MHLKYFLLTLFNDEGNIVMKLKRDKSEVGVVVGRFQTPELHGPHIDLIRSVIDNHDKVIIFLGLSPLKATFNNPLDFESRKGMIAEKFPEAIILYIKDQRSDEVWSKMLDEMIKDNIGPRHVPTLYGGRDSFILHYKGRYKTEELESDRIVSATEIREKISAKVKHTADWRAGVVWATQNTFPSVMATIDIAILNDDESECLFGRKEHESHYRFIGGFSDPVSDKMYEQTVKREVAEETGLEISDPIYIGSSFIDDWRYRYEKDKIITLFFKCRKVFGAVQANDDIVEARWLPITGTNNTRSMLGVPHQHLYDMLLSDLEKGVDDGK